MLSILKEKKLNNFRENNCNPLILLIVNLNLTHFSSILSHIYTGVDPYSEYGSTKLLNTDPVRIRIHNNENNLKNWILIAKSDPDQNQNASDTV